MGNIEVLAVLGFTALEFNSGMDAPTSGNLTFVIKDHPTNVDRHMFLLAKLIKSTLVLSVENDVFSISIREPNLIDA